MCGRFTHLYTWKQLHRLLTLTTPPMEIARRYNVAPMQPAPIVREVDGARTVAMLRWGLVPSWAEDDSHAGSAINARAETVVDKPAFRSAFKRRRCIVPVSGFFEWRVMPGEGLFGADASRTIKQPYYISGVDGEPLLLAGLWESWRGDSGEVETFAIITTAPNEMMARVHDRMPAVLSAEECGVWLACGADDAEAARALLRPCAADRLSCVPVSTWVNSPRHDDPRCVEAVGPSEP